MEEKTPTKYEIGQELDTVECGECIVKDILISPTTGKIVYSILTNEDNDTLLFFEEDLS